MKKLSAMILVSLLILLGFFTISCTAPKDPEPEENLSPADFFPLSVGRTWEYQGEGNEFASFTREVIFAQGNKAQIKEDNGGTVSASVFETSDDAVTRIFFMGEAYDDQNYLDTAAAENTVILKAPIKEGTKWNDPPQNGNSGSTREIVDINASVDTPAGKFDGCVKVKISNEDSTLYEYFKKDIGMVKREFISGDTTVTSSLKNYSKK